MEKTNIKQTAVLLIIFIFSLVLTASAQVFDESEWEEDFWDYYESIYSYTPAKPAKPARPASYKSALMKDTLQFAAPKGEVALRQPKDIAAAMPAPAQYKSELLLKRERLSSLNLKENIKNTIIAESRKAGNFYAERYENSKKAVSAALPPRLAAEGMTALKTHSGKTEAMLRMRGAVFMTGEAFVKSAAKDRRVYSQQPLTAGSKIRAALPVKQNPCHEGDLLAGRLVLVLKEGDTAWGIAKESSYSYVMYRIEIINPLPQGKINMNPQDCGCENGKRGKMVFIKEDNFNNDVFLRLLGKGVVAVK